MRGVVIKQSLADTLVLDRIRASIVNKYAFELAGQSVQIVELDVSEADALAVAQQLAETLHPRRFYAHLVGKDLMIVVFPGVLAFVRRGDPESARRAQRVGTGFDIPVSQMRFAELFDVDHPDGSRTVQAAPA